MATTNVVSPSLESLLESLTKILVILVSMDKTQLTKDPARLEEWRTAVAQVGAAIAVVTALQAKKLADAAAAQIPELETATAKLAEKLAQLKKISAIIDNVTKAVNVFQSIAKLLT